MLGSCSQLVLLQQHSADHAANALVPALPVEPGTAMPVSAAHTDFPGLLYPAGRQRTHNFMRKCPFCLQDCSVLCGYFCPVGHEISILHHLDTI